MHSCAPTQLTEEEKAVICPCSHANLLFLSSKARDALWYVCII
jgi:hypothetical protein